MSSENRGLLNIGGQTINLREKSPPGSICKDGLSSSSTSTDDDCAKWYVKFWRQNKLMILIIIGVLFGFLIGLSCNKPVQELEEPTRSTVITFLGFPGELLLRMLKMLILPLIITSLVVGVGQLDQRASGKLGMRAIAYYMGTTLCAVILGIILVVSINPGDAANPGESKAVKNKVRTVDSFLDLIRNMFPDNLVNAAITQLKTGVIVIVTGFKNVTVTNITHPTTEQQIEMKLYPVHTTIQNGTNVTWYTKNLTAKIAGDKEDKSGTNVLGLVVFSLALGLILGKMGKKAEVFIEWMNVLNDVVMILVTWVMWYSPIGICSLIAARFAKMAEIASTFESLGLYMLTVIIGLIIHSFVILPLIYFLSTRRNPLKYVVGIIQALLTAFGTSSSSATLPVTFNCLEENNGIDKRVTRFVLPIGATINMDGTALYEAVGAIFIAQASGMDLSVGQYIAISLTSTLASIGAAGIPQAGVVTMMIVLQTVGLPGEAVGLILSVDWFLDRLRTAVNVLGDAFGAGIVAFLSVEDLREMDIHHAKQARLEIENGLLSPQVEISIPNLNSEDNVTKF